MFRKKLFIKEIKEKLEKEKVSTEKQLQSFAKKDKKLAGDWETRFPKFNGGNSEEEADEVEEYEALLPIEFILENKLKNINLALEKIKKLVARVSVLKRFILVLPINSMNLYIRKRI